MTVKKLFTCERCGYEGEKCVIQIHHINKNHKDNRPENLIRLCSNCHVELHQNIWNLDEVIISRKRDMKASKNIEIPKLSELKLQIENIERQRIESARAAELENRRRELESKLIYA